MKTPRLRTILATGIVTVLFTTANMPAHAQLTVFDPTNFSQNVLTAARELQQVNNQIRSLQNEATSLINQATSLINEARNLASLPYSSLAQLEQSITQTQQLLAQAQRIVEPRAIAGRADRREVVVSEGCRGGKLQFCGQVCDGHS